VLRDVKHHGATRALEPELPALGEPGERLRRIVYVPEKQTPVARLEQSAAAKSLPVEEATQVEHDFRGNYGALDRFALDPGQETEITQGRQDVSSDLDACALPPLRSIMFGVRRKKVDDVRATDDVSATLL
jgi:hypothetical protein